MRNDGVQRVRERLSGKMADKTVWMVYNAALLAIVAVHWLNGSMRFEISSVAQLSWISPQLNYDFSNESTTGLISEATSHSFFFLE